MKGRASPDLERIAGFCRHWRIARPVCFASLLKEGFRPNRDAADGAEAGRPHPKGLL